MQCLRISRHGNKARAWITHSVSYPLSHQALLWGICWADSRRAKGTVCDRRVPDQKSLSLSIFGESLSFSFVNGGRHGELRGSELSNSFYINFSLTPLTALFSCFLFLFFLSFVHLLCLFPTSSWPSPGSVILTSFPDAQGLTNQFPKYRLHFHSHH